MCSNLGIGLHGPSQSNPDGKHTGLEEEKDGMQTRFFLCGAGSRRSRFDGAGGIAPNMAGVVAWGGARMSSDITPNITESFQAVHSEAADPVQILHAAGSLHPILRYRAPTSQSRDSNHDECAGVERTIRDCLSAVLAREAGYDGVRSWGLKVI